MIIAVVVLAVLLFGCIGSLVRLRGKIELQESSIGSLTGWCADLQCLIDRFDGRLVEAHNTAQNAYNQIVPMIKIVDSVKEQLRAVEKVYGQQLDYHRIDIDNLKTDFKNLQNLVAIIDGVQDEELCFAEDTSNDLGLLYDHLGLTIKTKEKKSGEITKKVVEA